MLPLNIYLTRTKSKYSKEILCCNVKVVYPLTATTNKIKINFKKVLLKGKNKARYVTSSPGVERHTMGCPP